MTFPAYALACPLDLGHSGLQFQLSVSPFHWIGTHYSAKKYDHEGILGFTLAYRCYQSMGRLASELKVVSTNIKEEDKDQQENIKIVLWVSLDCYTFIKPIELKLSDDENELYMI